LPVYGFPGEIFAEERGLDAESKLIQRTSEGKRKMVLKPGGFRLMCVMTDLYQGFMARQGVQSWLHE
jgi:hypothetical protein